MGVRRRPAAARPVAMGVRRRPAAARPRQRAAGVLKKPAKKKGAEMSRLHETLCSQKDFKEKCVAWVQTESVQNQVIEISARKDRAAKGALRLRMYCKSCGKCRKGKGWHGYAVHRNGTMTVYGTDVGTHGDFTHCYGGRGGLTAAQKHTVLQYLKSHNNSYKIQNIMQYLRKEKVAGGLPDESTVADFINNARNRKKATGHAIVNHPCWGNPILGNHSIETQWIGCMVDHDEL